MDLPAKTSTFKSISGRQAAQNALNSGCFIWEVQEKMNQSVTFQKISKKCRSVAPKHTFWNTKRIKRISQKSRIRKIKRILAQKCGPDPAFYTRRGPG